jgi:hypothetical protein
VHRRGHCIVKYSRGYFQRLQRRHCRRQRDHTPDFSRRIRAGLPGTKITKITP